jgi:hypothetical protein
MGGGAHHIIKGSDPRLREDDRLVSACVGRRATLSHQTADPLRMRERRCRIAALERRRNRPSSVLADASKGLLL